MDNNTQLEKQNLSKDSKGIESSKSMKDSVQLNILVDRTTKKKFMSFCLENDLTIKDAAENALLEFISNSNK